jgi:thiamine-monophosphate kinase
LTLALTALGEVPKGQAPLRSGAQIGDRIFVSGTIGDGALGLDVAKGGLDELATPLREHLLRRYRLPEPKVALGLALRGMVRAAIDISDGLVADLGHICAASAVDAELQAAMVPLSEAARIALARDPPLLSRVLTGGDDYELLFTADPKQSDRIVQAGIAAGVPVTGIGFITAPRPGDSPKVRLGDQLAVQTILQFAGYKHF